MEEDKIEKVGKKDVALERIIASLENLSYEDFVVVFKTAIEKGHADKLKDFIMVICRQRGYVSHGHINPAAQNVNLWKATANLAERMRKNPVDYCYLPPMLINNPELVERTLNEIRNPYAFLEVLTGESWQDMCKCSEFLRGFSTYSNLDAEEGCIATIAIALPA